MWRCPNQVSVEDKVVKGPGATSSTDVRRLNLQPKRLTQKKKSPLGIRAEGTDTRPSFRVTKRNDEGDHLWTVWESGQAEA